MIEDDLLVLRYVAVSARRSPVLVAANDFERQLDRLLARGYRPTCFSDAVTTPTHGRQLAVTFDGGLSSLLEHALPVLRRLGMTATVFVATAMTGDRSADGAALYPALGVASATERAPLTWEELADLAREGWEIGSMTRHHRPLPLLDDGQLADELRASRDQCARGTASACRALAYPYGASDARVMAAVEDAGYAAAAGIQARRLQVPLTLDWPRVPIWGDDHAARLRVRTSATVRRAQTFPIGSRAAARPFAVGATQQPAAGPPAQEERRPDGPRIAVIIPCHNDGALVEEAVASIVEPEPIEVVVVDDASSDPGTLEVLEGLRRRGVRVVTLEVNRGLPAARMTGLRATRSRYVFPLDADDLVVHGALSSMADLLDAHPEVAVCFGDYSEFGTHEGVRRVPAVLDPYRVVYRNDYPVSSLFRRSVLVSVGGWRVVGNNIGYEDWSLWMTLAERGERGLHWNGGVVLQRRLHGHRMLTDAGRQHLALYATLRTLHPRLFAQASRNRRTSTLARELRLAYPVLFGWRPPLSLWTRIGPVVEAVTGRLRRA